MVSNMIYRYKQLVAILFVAIFVPTAVVSANTVFRSGDSVTVMAEQQVEGDFYAAASTVSMSGTVLGDMYTAAGIVTLNGEVTADLFATGGSVQVHGTIADDARIIGGEVIVSESVAGDLVIIGGSVQVLSTASIEGDVLLFAGEAEIAGTVGGSVLGAADQLRIDGPVGGEVDVHTSTLTLGDRAQIAGDIRYTAVSDLRRAANADVAGTITRQEQSVSLSVREQVQAVFIPVLVLVFATLACFLFARDPIVSLVVETRNRFWFSALIGLLVILATPPLVAMLLTSVIGLLFGAMVLLGYIVVLLGALVLSPIFLGAWLTEFVVKRFTVSLPQLGIGFTMLFILLILPPVAVMVWLMLMSALVGTLTILVYRTLFTSA